jgi:hypothetical protein
LSATFDLPVGPVALNGRALSFPPPGDFFALLILPSGKYNARSWFDWLLWDSLWEGFTFTRRKPFLVNSLPLKMSFSRVSAIPSFATLARSQVRDHG